jgi:hypothetical protein
MHFSTIVLPLYLLGAAMGSPVNRVDARDSVNEAVDPASKGKNNVLT